MAACRDKRIAALMHAYELGMLSDSDREELELHLMDCDACFEKIRRFGDSAQLLRNDRDLQDSARTMATEENEAEAKPAKATRFPNRLRKAFIPAFLVTAVVLIVLVLKPWHIEITPTHEAVAAENRLAVMSFDDVTDPDNSQKLGEIAANLLITDLSESKYMQVASSQRIHDILKLIKRDDTTVPDQDIATQVARRAGAGRMLTGKILQVEPNYVITTQLVDVTTGDAVAARRIVGDETDDIFTIVDKLTVAVKRDLALPQKAWEEPDRSVAEVTTASPEAYRHYIDGVDLYGKFYKDEARRSFEKAIACDSTFAMAYYFLAFLVDDSLIAKAVQYSNNVTRKERFFINSLAATATGDRTEAIGQLEEAIIEFPEEKMAHYLLAKLKTRERRNEEAIEHLKRAVEIDPLYKTAYNHMAYVYSYIDDLENAILSIDKYISLAPNEANPYDSRGDLYAAFGKTERAIESYKKALVIKPDFTASLQKMGNLHLLRREFDRADSCYRVLTRVDQSITRADARHYLAVLPLYQGKFTQALTLFDEYIAADSADNQMRLLPVKHFQKVRIYVEQGDFDRAVREMEICVNTYRRQFPADRFTYRDYHIQVLAEAGLFDEADSLTVELKQDLEEDGRRLKPYWYALGAIALSRGEAEMAAGYLENINTETVEFPVHFMLARAYQQSGRLSDAIVKYQKLMTAYNTWRLCWNIWDVKMQYYLGLAYEQSQWHDKAVEQYSIFLEYWKDADPGIAEIEDARVRLARLQSES